MQEYQWYFVRLGILCLRLTARLLLLDVKQRTEPEDLDTTALAAIVIPGLRAGLASIDSKQPETVIGEFISQHTLSIMLKIYFRSTSSRS